jgi:hypothetical protein
MDEGLKRLAEVLGRAHVRYRNVFGVEPHGTLQQMAAMLEMCPEAKEYIRLYEDARNKALTE